MCADIGSRKIRDEIAAMEVLAVNPIATLVVPRIWAAIFVAMLLDGFVSVAGIAGGYFFNVIIQGGTPGAYLASFSLLGADRRPDRGDHEGRRIRPRRGHGRGLLRLLRQGRP